MQRKYGKYKKSPVGLFLFKHVTNNIILLIITISNGHMLQFDFKSNIDIKMINSLISKYVL